MYDVDKIYTRSQTFRILTEENSLAEQRLQVLE